jgi:hypothetical protein
MQIFPPVWLPWDLIQEFAATSLLLGQNVIVWIIHGQQLT